MSGSGDNELQNIAVQLNPNPSECRGGGAPQELPQREDARDLSSVVTGTWSVRSL